MSRGPNIDRGIIVLKPGESLKPHYHNQVEETFYFLKGALKLIIEDREYRVKEGGAFRIEPKERHDLVNDTQEAVKAVMIKFPYLSERKEE